MSINKKTKKIFKPQLNGSFKTKIKKPNIIDIGAGFELFTVNKI